MKSREKTNLVPVAEQLIHLKAADHFLVQQAKGGLLAMRALDFVIDIVVVFFLSDLYVKALFLFLK